MTTVDERTEPGDDERPLADRVWARLTPEVWLAVARSCTYDIGGRPLNEAEINQVMALGPRFFQELLYFALAGDGNHG